MLWKVGVSSSSVAMNFGQSKSRVYLRKLTRFVDDFTVVQAGDPEVMVTVINETKSSHSLFMFLVVDNRQKATAAGGIPIYCLRREVGFSDKEMVTSEY